jgi:hypothetical protein
VKREHRETLNEIIDEALATWEDPADVTGQVVSELESLEAGGLTWAGDFLASCLWSGVRSRIRSRARAGRAAVGGQSVPTCYVTGGTVTSWLHAPAEDLGSIVDRLHDQADTLIEHAQVIELGKKLATEHNVETAWLGFEAAGVSVVVAS